MGGSGERKQQKQKCGRLSPLCYSRFQLIKVRLMITDAFSKSLMPANAWSPPAKSCIEWIAKSGKGKVGGQHFSPPPARTGTGTERTSLGDEKALAATEAKLLALDVRHQVERHPNRRRVVGGAEGDAAGCKHQHALVPRVPPGPALRDPCPKRCPGNVDGRACVGKPGEPSKFNRETVGVFTDNPPPTSLFHPGVAMTTYRPRWRWSDRRPEQSRPRLPLRSCSPGLLRAPPLQRWSWVRWRKEGNAAEVKR